MIAFLLLVAGTIAIAIGTWGFTRKPKDKPDDLGKRLYQKALEKGR